MPIKNQTSWDNAFKESSNKYRKFLDLLYAKRLRRLGICDRLKFDSSVLEIGCGDGSAIKAIKKCGYENVWGIDIVDYEKVIDFPFVKGSMTAMSFRDNSFDSLILINAFHHLISEEEYAMALKEMNRCLKPNGFIFFHEPSNTFFRKFLYFTSFVLPVKVLKQWRLRSDEEKEELSLFWEKNPLKNIVGFKLVQSLRSWKSACLILQKIDLTHENTAL